jgi:hypothetical protein
LFWVLILTPLWGPVGWVLIALAGLAGALSGPRLWRLSLKRLSEDERLGPWIEQTFEAVEVPPLSTGTPDGASGF